MKTKRRKVEGRNRLEENAKRKIWTTNNELKQRKLATKVLYLGSIWWRPRFEKYLPGLHRNVFLVEHDPKIRLTLSILLHHEPIT